MELKEALEEFERRFLIQRLRDTKSISRAAGTLGVSRGTLYRRIRMLKITEEEIDALPHSAPAVSFDDIGQRGIGR